MIMEASMLVHEHGDAFLCCAGSLLSESYSQILCIRYQVAAVVRDGPWCQVLSDAMALVLVTRRLVQTPC
jgi:hypothetical protein